MKAYIIELVGTFFLATAIAFTKDPLIIGAVLVSMIYMGGYISGGHYNPAVSLGFFLRGKLTPKELGNYVLFQVLGALLAAVVYVTVIGQRFVPQPDVAATLYAVILLESLFAFALVFVALHTTSSKSVIPNQYYGLAIGLTLLVGVSVAGRITGGLFNPAVALGAALANLKDFGPYLSTLLWYIIAPCIGAVVATLVYRVTTDSDE